MKVKLLKGIKYEKGRARAGDVIEVDEGLYGILVGKGVIDGGEGFVGGGQGGKGKGGAGGGGDGAGDAVLGGLDSMTRSELIDYLTGAGIEFDSRDDKATLLGLAKKG